MAFILKYKYLLLCIIGNLGFFALAYHDYGKLKVTILHLIVGIVPLIYQIAKLLSAPPKEDN